MRFYRETLLNQMQNRRECKLFGRRARIPACNICVKQHNSHGRPRKSSRCLAFEAFTKIRTASRVVEVGTTGMYDRLRSWCPAALSYAAVLMTRKPASNRFVFSDRSSSGFLRNSHSRRDDPRLIFRSRHPGWSILSIIESELVVHRLRDRVIRHRVIRPIQLSLCS